MEALPRHQCFIYEGSPAGHLRSLALLTKKHLQAGHRCLSLNSPTMVAGIRYYMAAAGVNVTREVENGSLVFSSDNFHLVDGRFDAPRMIEMLARTVDQSLADGYKGVFATGDMTWEFGAEKDFEKLVEYERTLEALFQTTPALFGVCQYHRDTLPVHAVRDALITHRAIYINETLSRINPFYSSAALSGASADVSHEQVTHMLGALKKWPG